MKFLRTHIVQTMQRAAAFAAAVLACAYVSTHVAMAAPTGGVVTGGAASIGQSGATTTITQTTDRAILRWDQFDIGSSETVRFVQPGAGSIAVNRIRDSKPSQIDGQLQANGKLVLLNPNGVVFGSTARVDVAGLVASSADISDEASFLAGGQLKLGTPGAADAAIVNRGQITVAQAGLVGLVAPHVENHGLIQAKLGKVALASGDIATLDLAGDNLVKVEASDAIVAQAVRQQGTIDAAGGTVLISAADARNSVDALILHSGTTRTDSQDAGPAGSITLAAGRGTVQLQGTLSARGTGTTSRGGAMTVTAKRIHASSGAVADASGRAGGGQIRIGGDYQGSGTLPRAEQTTIDAGATIRANATESGDAGSIIVWSDKATRFAGHAEARAAQGRGGLIEVSGKHYLAFRGTVDLFGLTARGQLLLDPTDLTIANAADQDVTASSPFTPVADDVTSILDAATLLAALASGDVVVQTRSSGSQLGDIIVDAALSWTSGRSLTLDAHNRIIVNAAINAGAGGSLTLNAQDVQIGAALSGTGTLHFLPRDISTSMGIGNAALGSYLIDSTELGFVTNGWNSLVFGRTDGTGGMNLTAATWNDHVTLQSGSGVIAIDGTQNFGTNNLTFITDGDIALNNNLTGSGTLTLTTATAGGSIGLGDGQLGGLLLDGAEMVRITNGWSSILVGRTDGTGNINLGTLTWNDPLTLRSDTGVITVNGNQTMGGNALNITTNGDIALNANLSGTGTLTITPNNPATSIGLGNGQTGAINLTAAEVARIANGWGNLIFGTTSMTGNINLGALTWNDFLTLQTLSGIITVNGTQNLGNNALTLRTDNDIVLNANLTGTGGNSNLTIVQTSAGTSMGLGNAQAGTVNLDTTEIGRITNGWNSLTFGRADGTAAMNVGALTWNDNLTLQTGNGQMHINGNQALGANSLTLRTNSDLALGGNLGGTGTLTLVQSNTNVSMGLAGGAGTVNLDATELARITNGWGSLVFGLTNSTAAMNVNAATWNDNVTLRTGSGVMTIAGAQALGGNSLTIQTDANLALNDALGGTGNLTIQTSSTGTSMGLGDTMVGTLNLTNAELANISNGWGSITFGNTNQTGVMNIGAYTWLDPVSFRTSSGLMTVHGNQNFGANAASFFTDSNLALNGNLSGTSTLLIRNSNNATSMGLAGGAGTLNLTVAELNRIQDGFSSLTFGQTGQTGVMNINGYSWNDSVSFQTNTGVIAINGTQNLGTNNLTIQTGANLDLTAALNGSGAFSLIGAANGTTIGLGTGQVGNIQLTDTEISLISDGWSSLTFGTTAMTGTLNVGERTWLDSVNFRTDTGVITFNGAQRMDSNDLTIQTNSNLNLTNNLIGSGTLNILGSNNATTIGIAGGAGTLNLSAADLAFISDGWGLIRFGGTGTTGAMTVNAATWNDSVAFMTNSGGITIAGAQDVGANNLTITSNANPAINAALTGSGLLTLDTTANNTSIGLAGGAGTFAIDATELGRITNGWNEILIGRTDGTGAIIMNAASWNDNLTVQSAAGVITVAGAQTMGANNLTFRTNSNLAVNAALSGSGILSIQPMAVTTTIGLSGGAGTLNLDATEISRFTDGWGQIIIGRADATGALTANAQTWADNLTLRTGTGTLTVAGNLTLGANSLTLETDSNLALNGNLSGTGILTIRGSTTNTTMGIGNGQAGTLALVNTELARILTGWGTVVFGGELQSGAINIGANSWANDTQFISRGNIVLNGAQTSTKTSGTTLVFATTNGAFINNAGASAITTSGTGRFLVYSVDEANDTLGGLARPTILTNRTFAAYGPAAVTEAGNVFLYAGNVPKVLYLSIDNKTKEYGGNLPLLTFTYLSGLQGNDTLANVLTSYLLSVVGNSALDPAGTTRPITGSFTTGLGYTVNVTDGTLTVTKAPITVQVNNQTRTYGAANPAFTLTYLGFRNGDDVADIDVLASTGASGAGPTTDVGTYSITSAGGAFDNNYDFTYASGTLTITKAALTVTVNNTSRAYGAANPTFTFNYAGFLNGEDASVLDNAATATTPANALSAVGSYAITGSVGLDNNYAITVVNGTLTVTPAVITVTANNATRTYGAANPAFGVSYAGFANGETSAVFSTLATATSSATVLSNVGNYAIIASGASASNYSFTYVDGTLSITPATLTATANNASRTYGAANPAFGITYTGFVNGEDSSVIDTLATATTAANALSNVGSYAITASGAADNNYNFIYAPGTLTITPATLTATANNASRTYGAANPAFSVTYTGFVNGENSSVIDTLATATTAANALSNVGSYAITASGAADNNYSFTYVDGTLSITPATLTATANNASRTYGAANPAFGITYTGFVNGENSSVIDTLATASTTANALSNVGSYAITASGAADNNYNFTYVDGTLSITPATLTATANNTSRTYGAANPAFGITYTGFVNGENSSVIDTLATATTAANALSNVGSYAITASGAADNNYSFTYVDGTLSITPATLTATANNSSRTYGAANPVLGITYTGFVNGENSSVIDTLATASTTANALSNVGSYAITASGAADNNYSFTYVDGMLAVTKASLMATAGNGTRTYGAANPAFGVTYTGFVNGEDASVIDTLATATTAANALSNVGSYAVTASGAFDNNYDFTYAPGTLTITKATLTATANNASRTYGAANPVLGITYTGFMNGENSSVINTLATASTTANALSNVGSYAITASGAFDNNYDFTYAPGTLTITPATLTATANNVSRTYGAANPAFGITYTGFVNGENSSVIDTLATASTTANALSNVGSYAITASGAADNNYNFIYAPGTLTITKATLTATADNATRFFDAPNPTFSFTYSGFVNGEDASVIDTLAVGSTPAVAGGPSGTYSITGSGALDNNYQFVYVAGTLTVLPDPTPPPPPPPPTSPTATVVPPTSEQPDPTRYFARREFSAVSERPAPGGDSGDIVIISLADAEIGTIDTGFLIAITDELSVQTYGAANFLYTRFTPMSDYIEELQRRKKRRVARWL